MFSEHKQTDLFCFLICKQSLYTLITQKLQKLRVWNSRVCWSGNLFAFTYFIIWLKKNKIGKTHLQEIRVNVMCILMKFSQSTSLNFIDQVETTFIIRTCITIQISRIELISYSWNTRYGYIRYSFFFHATNDLKRLFLWF